MDIDCLLAEAETLCRRRGVRLTAQRRQVLAIVGASEQPLGAYEILDQLAAQSGRRPAPPTVYRALEFLRQQGLVHRLQTLQAFVVCDHPCQPHAGQFLICNRCGEVQELADRRIDDSLCQAASASGFVAEQPTVEIAGRCGRCRGRGA